MAGVALIDTNVFVHVLGRDAALRDACAAILSGVADRRFDAVISTETVQELLHVRHRKTGDRAEAVALARSVSEAYRMLPVLDADVADALDLAARHQDLSARDAFIFACAVNAGVDAVISADRAFAGPAEEAGLTLVDPVDPESVRSLLE